MTKQEEGGSRSSYILWAIIFRHSKVSLKKRYIADLLMEIDVVHLLGTMLKCP